LNKQKLLERPRNPIRRDFPAAEGMANRTGYWTRAAFAFEFPTVVCKGPPWSLAITPGRVSCISIGFSIG